VQVPDAGSVTSVDALAGKRIVTSFEVLAGRFFADVDDRVGLVGDARTSIEYVGGSVEAACALGLADAIGACHPSLLSSEEKKKRKAKTHFRFPQLTS
jgi:ATP phosphoribosyltransferase